ncbi:ATP-binding cassette domain-containing protein, partial [Streptomyces sp. PKU-EA00015]|uniref:ATP-binding cassette domain-containing protein n=1 Tax=Streptomyces sp. PKU-EA00015 TaxID=2748326 RepID=UPI0035C86DF8
PSRTGAPPQAPYGLRPCPQTPDGFVLPAANPAPPGDTSGRSLGEIEARGPGRSPGYGKGRGGEDAPRSGPRPRLLARLLPRLRRPKAHPAPQADAPRSDDTARTRALSVRRARVDALRRVDLTVGPGETIALMGRNGAGKSTLLGALVGMVEPTSGTVAVSGRIPHRTHPRELIRHVGLVPQEPRDLLYADTVAAECAAADADARAARGSCRALVSELLPDVPDDTHPRDLSEGQRLALALAVVLTARPPLILLDEPTRGLDYAAKARLVGVLRALAAEGHAIVLATHDVELAAELAHRVVILAGGEVVADGPTAEVVVSSPAFAPQVAKVLAPQPWLTVSQVEAALAEEPGEPGA